MKRITVLLLVILMILIFTGCNMSFGFGSAKFERVHIDTPQRSTCFEIVKWYENDSGVEVDTKEWGHLFFSEGTYTMMEEECPYCREAR